MSQQFDEVKQHIIAEINQLTVNTLDLLTNLWGDTFEDSLCTANAKKLSEHVKIFYDEILDETRTRQDKIKLEINKLHTEASNLKKLLNVDIELTPEFDMPLYSLQIHLNENLQILREQLEHRQGKIDILLEEQKALCEVLDEEPRNLLSGPALPTEGELHAFRQYLDSLIIEKHNRLNEINKLRNDIGMLSMKLEISIEDMGDDTLLNDTCLLLTKNNLSKLFVLRTDLQNRFNFMREEIDRMKGKLEKLWSVFELDENVKKQFENIEYNQENYCKISRELEFWEQERRANIKKFVSKAREEILYWWDKNLFSESERANFSNFSSNCFTEDLLTLHEMELRDLKDFYYENERMFNLIKERQRLWYRMQAIEQKAREPGRYNNRGGQLLKEEKERKVISTKLPEIEHEILTVAHDYEENTHKKFTAYGVPVAELIEKDWAKKIESKEEVKSARKKPPATTPFKAPPLTRQQNSTVKKVMKFVSNNNTENGTKENYRLTAVPKSLLKQIPTCSKMLGTPNRQPKKTPVKVIYSIEKRRSGRVRKSGEKRVSKGRVAKTRVQINNSAATESVDYDSFKDYITPRTPCRSSMMSPQNKHTQTPTSKRHPLTPIHGTPQRSILAPKQGIITPKATALPSFQGTPKSTKRLLLNRSPMTNRTYTPSPSTSKFSTVNLPILM